MIPICRLITATRKNSRPGPAARGVARGLGDPQRAHHRLGRELRGEQPLQRAEGEPDVVHRPAARPPPRRSRRRTSCTIRLGAIPMRATPSSSRGVTGTSTIAPSRRIRSGKRLARGAARAPPGSRRRRGSAGRRCSGRRRRGAGPPPPPALPGHDLADAHQRDDADRAHASPSPSTPERTATSCSCAAAADAELQRAARAAAGPASARPPRSPAALPSMARISSPGCSPARRGRRARLHRADHRPVVEASRPPGSPIM